MEIEFPVPKELLDIVDAPKTVPVPEQPDIYDHVSKTDQRIRSHFDADPDSFVMVRDLRAINNDLGEEDLMKLLRANKSFAKVRKGKMTFKGEKHDIIRGLRLKTEISDYRKALKQYGETDSTGGARAQVPASPKPPAISVAQDPPPPVKAEAPKEDTMSVMAKLLERLEAIEKNIVKVNESKPADLEQYVPSPVPVAEARISDAQDGTPPKTDRTELEGRAQSVGIHSADSGSVAGEPKPSDVPATVVKSVPVAVAPVQRTRVVAVGGRWF